MQVLMENKKKQLIYIVIILVSAGSMVWMWWGSGLLGGGDTNQPPPGSPMAISGSSTSTPATILPYGKNLKTGVFSDPRFKSLVVPPKLEVLQKELGRDNPFLPL